MNQSKTTKIILAFTSILIIGLITFYFSTSTLPLGEKYKSIDHYGGEFTLQSADGPVSLSDFKGKAVVIYFGFLSCTEACPASMSVLKKALNRVPKEQLPLIQPIFISVDPKRDSVDNLKEFSYYYHPNMIGLTDTEENIKALSKQYGVFFELVDLEGSAANYTVDHSSRFYIIDKEGTLITTMSHSTTPNELAAKLSSLL